MRSDARKRLSVCQHPNPIYSRSECGFCGGQDCYCRDCQQVLCGCRVLVERERPCCDAAEKVTRAREALDSWQMQNSRYHTIRAIDFDLRAALGEN